MFIYNFRSLLVGLCLCTLVSCEATHEVWLDNMQGSLDYNVPSPMGIKQDIQFMAGGITTPSEGIVYEWQAQGFSPSSGTGQSFVTQTPEVAGSYSVVVTVRSTGFREMSIKKVLYIQHCISLSGILDFSVSAPVVAGHPVILTASGIHDNDAVRYTWNAPSFTPSTYEGNTFSPICPPIDDVSMATDYPVTVTASAEGYCSTDTVKQVTVHPCMPLPGELDFSVSTPAVANLPVTFTASGISGDVGAITYTWNAASFTPSTYEGNTFSPQCPATATGYNVTLTAVANGYCSATVSKQVDVVGGKDMGTGSSFNVLAPSTVYVSDQITFAPNFTPGGIHPPNSEQITYFWQCNACSPSTFLSTSQEVGRFHATVLTEGEHTVNVTARAAGFNSVSTTYTFKSLCKPITEAGANFSFSAVPAQVVSGALVEFQAAGIKSGLQGVTYTWSAPHFTPATYDGGPTFSTTSPSTAVENNYEVSVTATAPYYCSVTDSHPVTVLAGHVMEGELSITPSQTNIYLSDEITFTAGGITHPAPDEVTYTWQCENCTPNSGTGSQYTAKVSSAPGDYTLILTASATNFSSVTKSYPFAVVCKPMPTTEGFHVAPGTNVAVNTDLTFTAVPPAGISGMSYTWTVPLSTASGTSTSTATAKAPDTPQDVPVKLTMEAAGYCPATYTKTISVVSCQPMEKTPSISPDDEVLTGYGQYTFSTPNAGALPNINYSWSITPDGFTYTPTSGATATEFKVTAPPYTDANTLYTLQLTVTADGYCTETVTRRLSIQSLTGVMSGTVIIDEAIPVALQNSNDQRSLPSIWVGQGAEVTLHAKYNPGIGEISNDVLYDWYLNTIGKPLTGNTATSVGVGPTITFTPGGEAYNQSIIVRIRPKEDGPDAYRRPGSTMFAYDVQFCQNYTAPDLFININNQCRPRTINGFSNYTAWIKDARGGKYPIVHMPNSESGDWWFQENLQIETESSYNGYKTAFGIYYKYSSPVASEMREPAANKYCPTGWRIPTDGEWSAMFVGVGEPNASSSLRSSGNLLPNAQPQNGVTDWITSSYPGMDSYGFKVLPGGYYTGTELRTYNYVDDWSNYATYKSAEGNCFRFNSDRGAMQNISGGATGCEHDRYYTIRCIKD